MAGKIYDVAILGGGHNGLTAAGYLAAAGLSVIVLEKNSVVGGAALTEEFAPGFQNSVAAYTVSLLNPKVIHDLDLARHGLRIVERPAANFWPVDDKRSLLMPYGLVARQRAIAAFSERDAERASDKVAVDHPYAVLRNRDFLLYLIGRLVATFGQQMFVMALGWELYERTHSAFMLGLVGLTQVVPMALCLPRSVNQKPPAPSKTMSLGPLKLPPSSFSYRRSTLPVAASVAASRKR